MANPKRATLICSAALLMLAVSAAGSTKGRLEMTFSQTTVIEGTQIDPGQVRIEWTSNSPEATVSFSRNGKVIKEARGRLVERESKADRNMMVFAQGEGGRLILKEIRLHGKKQVLTFD